MKSQLQHRAWRGCHVGIEQIAPDAVLGQEHELGIKVLELVVGLADAGLAVGDCNHCHSRELSTG